MTGDVHGAMRAGAAVVSLAASDTTIELVRIAPGDLVMGSPPDEPGRSDNDVPARRVRLTRAFYLGRHEITQAQYRAVMKSLPTQPPGDDLPVSQIRYRDALEFCRRLSAMSGVTVGLPTEAQWEYASRAGTQTAYWSGASEADLARIGWYRGNAGGGVHPVGEKPANPWGLHDMQGNVWEFCADFFPDANAIGPVDPVGEQSPWRGAMRGGGWMHDASDCRAARRMLSDDMFGGAGFRIAVDAGESGRR